MQTKSDGPCPCPEGERFRCSHDALWEAHRVVTASQPSRPGGNATEATYEPSEPVQPPTWTPTELTQVAIDKAVAADLRKLATIVERHRGDWPPSILAECLRIRACRRDHTPYNPLDGG